MIQIPHPQFVNNIIDVDTSLFKWVLTFWSQNENCCNCDVTWKIKFEVTFILLLNFETYKSQLKLYPRANEKNVGQKRFGSRFYLKKICPRWSVQRYDLQIDRLVFGSLANITTINVLDHSILQLKTDVTYYHMPFVQCYFTGA